MFLLAHLEPPEQLRPSHVLSGCLVPAYHLHTTSVPLSFPAGSPSPTLFPLHPHFPTLAPPIL